MNTEKIFSYGNSKLTFTRRVTYSPTRESFPEHSHARLEIVLCNSGNHSYFVDGERHILEAGTLIAVAPGVTHRVFSESESYDRFSVVIHPTLLPEGAIEKFGRSVITLKISHDDEIYQLLRKAERYSRELPEAAHELIFTALATELYYMVLAKALSEKPTASNIINRAVEYIDEHFADIDSISRLCDQLYVSKSYFHSLFREHIKKTPLAYLNERRLYFAKLKILSGEKPTKVFRECGFVDYTSFYRSYKKLFGYPPSELARVCDSDGENSY